MSPERWQRVDELFAAAAAMELHQVAGFLDRECNGDAELRREVEALLSADREADTFIGQPAVCQAAELIAGNAPDPLLGRRLGHYRVLARLGVGGMGEVLLAQDARLGRKVALKLLPDHFTRDPDRLARFRREARAASALNHPNIITVHDIGREGQAHFIAMEFVEGQTLRHRLDGGPLAPGAALGIAEQVAAALAAAHGAGVVHRDIKPENVMLRPDGYVKVLDFGLAKLTERLASTPDASGAVSVDTQPGVVMGTVHYMSPEQARGQEVDGRTDIWSLGVVLYEMLAGRRPFEGPTSSDVIAAILHHQPPFEPLRAGQPPELERIISKALEKDPRRRYQDLKEMVADLIALRRRLEDDPGGAHPLQPATSDNSIGVSTADRAGDRQTRPFFAADTGGKPRWRRWRVRVAIGAAVLLLTLAGYFLIPRAARNPALPAADNTPIRPVGSRRSVAVLGLKNLSGRTETAWLSTALSEMLSTELAAGEQLRVVLGETVARAKVDLRLSEAESYPQATLQRLRANLGADFVVTGSYVAVGKDLGGQLRLDLRLLNAETGETAAAASEVGSEDKLFDLVSRAARRLREKLGLRALSAEEVARIRNALPTSPEAARLYAEGLARLRRFDPLGARGLLEKAAAAEPDFPLAHAALAAALAELGYMALAREAAKKAYDLSASLSREGRLWVEAQYHEAAGAWQKAVEIYRAFWAQFPDEIEYGLRLANAQAEAAQVAASQELVEAALATVEEMRRLLTPASDDPRIDEVEAKAADMAGDYNRAIEAGARMVKKGEALGSRLIMGKGHLAQAYSTERLGYPQKVLENAEAARQHFAAIGYRKGEGMAINVKGWGGDGKGKQYFKEALAIYRQMGHRAYEAGVLDSLGEAYGQNPAAAKKYFEESLAIARELDDKGRIAIAEFHLGNLLFGTGDLAGAARYLGGSQYEEDNPDLMANPFFFAPVLIAAGDLDRARRLLEKLITTSRETGQTNDYTLFFLGDVLYWQGDLAGARAALEQMLAEAGDRELWGLPLSARYSLALILLEEGLYTEAEQHGREIAKAPTWGREAHTLAAKVLFAQGKVAEARAEVNRSRTPSHITRDYEILFQITAGRVSAHEGKYAAARKTLEAALREAQKLSRLGLQYEARLALGETELRAGNAAAGRAQLEQLEEEARAKGFGLIVSKAAALRQ